MLHGRLAFSAYGLRFQVFFRRLFILGLILTFTGVPACRGLDLTRAEKFVLETLKQGNVADLDDSSTKDHVLSHQFVEDLLTGRYSEGNIGRKGVRIAHAVFKQSIAVQHEVPYRVEFQNCTFNAGIDFSGSQFDGDLLFENSSFTGPVQGAESSDDDEPDEVLLIGTTVKGTLTFSSDESGSTEFDVPLDLTRLQAGALVLNANFDVKDSDESDPDLDLTEAYVASDFSLSVVTDRPKYVGAEFLKVDGLMTLGSAPSAQSAGEGFFPISEFDLSHTRFQSLTIYGFNQQWLNPSTEGSASLDGFSFQYLYIDQATDFSAWSMLQFVDLPRCRYSASPYLMLEQYFRSNGYPEWADDAYIKMRIRQRREAIWKHRKAGWIADWLLYQLTGYGRRPSRSLPVVLAFMLLGMFIFPNQNRMEPQDSKSNPGPYSPFWYSLDLLLPIIELGAASTWRPKQDWWFGRTYAPLQRMAGWILLPLILAAITGYHSVTWFAERTAGHPDDVWRRNPLRD